MTKYYAACNPELGDYEIMKVRKEVKFLDDNEAIDYVIKKGEAILLVFTDNNMAISINEYNDCFAKINLLYDGPREYLICLGEIRFMPNEYKRRFLEACFKEFEE